MARTNANCSISGAVVAATVVEVVVATGVVLGRVVRGADPPQAARHQSRAPPMTSSFTARSRSTLLSRIEGPPKVVGDVLVESDQPDLGDQSRATIEPLPSRPQRSPDRLPPAGIRICRPKWPAAQPSGTRSRLPRPGLPSLPACSRPSLSCPSR